MYTTEHKNRFTFKSTTRMIMTLYSHIWQSTPFVLINIVDFWCSACSNSTSSDNNIFVTNSTSRMSVPWIIHICSILKHVSITLLLKLAALNVWLGSCVIKITSSNHKYLALRWSKLNNLKIMREYIILTFSILRVYIVGSCVSKSEFLTLSG